MKKGEKQTASLDSVRVARTAESREEDMIGLAMDLVEERLRNGTATSQETTHFLKLATQRERLERLKLEQEIELSKAKIDSLRTAEETKKLYEEAIRAFRTYQGDYEGYDDEDI